MKNHIVIQSVHSLRLSNETFEETKERITSDSNSLHMIFNRVQNDFNDVKSLKKYIKKLQEDK